MTQTPQPSATIAAIVGRPRHDQLRLTLGLGFSLEAEDNLACVVFPYGQRAVGSFFSASDQAIQVTGDDCDESGHTRRVSRWPQTRGWSSAVRPSAARPCGQFEVLCLPEWLRPSEPGVFPSVEIGEEVHVRCLLDELSRARVWKGHSHWERRLSSKAHASRQAARSTPERPPKVIVPRKVATASTAANTSGTSA